MAEVVQAPDKKAHPKLSDEELTRLVQHFLRSVAFPKQTLLHSRAIEEIFREVHVAQIRSREFGSDKWAACPLRKTNKRFLSSTLRSVEVHNKRHDTRIKKSSDVRLKEIASKSDSDHRESYSERRERDRHRRERSKDRRHARHHSEGRRRENKRVEPPVDYRQQSYEVYEPPLATHPAQFMYYYPPQVITPLHAPPDEAGDEKPQKKRKKKSTEPRKRPKKSKTKDKKREKLKKKKKSSIKKRKSSSSEPEDCYEVVDLTD
jgi:hypothetical protein